MGPSPSSIVSDFLEDESIVVERAQRLDVVLVDRVEVRSLRQEAVRLVVEAGRCLAVAAGPAPRRVGRIGVLVRDGSVDSEARAPVLCAPVRSLARTHIAAPKALTMAKEIPMIRMIPPATVSDSLFRVVVLVLFGFGVYPPLRRFSAASFVPDHWRVLTIRELSCACDLQRATPTVGGSRRTEATMRAGERRATAQTGAMAYGAAPLTRAANSVG